MNATTVVAASIKTLINIKIKFKENDSKDKTK